MKGNFMQLRASVYRFKRTVSRNETGTLVNTVILDRLIAFFVAITIMKKKKNAQRREIKGRKKHRCVVRLDICCTSIVPPNFPHPKYFSKFVFKVTRRIPNAFPARACFREFDLKSVHVIFTAIQIKKTGKIRATFINLYTSFESFLLRLLFDFRYPFVIVEISHARNISFNPF